MNANKSATQLFSVVEPCILSSRSEDRSNCNKISLHLRQTLESLELLQRIVVAGLSDVNRNA
jgi:hypothetical protein